MTSLLKELSEEKVVLVDTSKSLRFSFPLEGVVRFVDKRGGKTLGILLSSQTLQEIEENIEASNPEFIASLEASRKSGRVSGKEVKRKAGL